PDDEQLLPTELKQLFGEFHCNLCRTRMNSHISANIHYQSKAHEKKINQWLKEYCAETGTPVPVRQRPPLELAAETNAIGKSVFHCEACDLVLTSVQHANQHYTGKRHAMVVNGKKLPSGTGHYNAEGKWIRTKQSVQPATAQPTTLPSKGGPEGGTTLEQEIRKKEGLDCVDDTGTFCLICETSVTSRSEMLMHLKGAKHLKKARSMGVIVRTTPFNASDTILRSLSVPPRQTDWSLYRMPSGKFYCKTCNLIVADEKLFGQHWYGKKHKLKQRQEQQAEKQQ
ncbi:AGAP011573-PA, partial [Anopheles gambiae str. PEST]